MWKLGELATQEVQMVFLTVTLPLQIEAEFMGIIKVQPEDVHIFHTPTTRPNIAYSVFEHNLDMDKTNTVCQLVHEKLEQYLVPSKIIIYSRTIK